MDLDNVSVEVHVQVSVVHIGVSFLLRTLGSRFTTQSLLLLEKQSGQTLEMTAQDCLWQTKTENGWRKVQPELLLQGAASVDAWQQKECFTHGRHGNHGKPKTLF